MITDIVQRWHDGRGSYRPAGELFDPTAYEVSLLADDARAKAFVCEHHYEGSYPAARFRAGLFHKTGALHGVAVFSVPCNMKTLAVIPGPDLEEKTELGRFVLLDEVRANGESWFLARAFELLRREGVRGLVSFSDPTSRTDAAGDTVFRGHVGTIYQATNAVYLGLNEGRWLRLLPSGEILHNRALAKIRARDQGCRYASEILVRAGAAPLRDDEDARAWVKTWTERLTRRVWSPGKHKYVFGLDRVTKKHLPASLDYPKVAA
jgi:hypothetical protein